MRYPLSVKSKSVETSGIPRDYKEALCEYVWNGFEANATTISITHTINVLGGIEDKSVEIQIRIAQIDQEFKSLLNSVTAENQQELLTDPRITDLMTEKRQLEKELAEYAAAEQHRQNTASRLDNIFTILDGMKNHPLTYDDAVIRQILQCVIVESKEKIKVVFIGGMEVETEVEQ